MNKKQLEEKIKELEAKVECLRNPFKLCGTPEADALIGQEVLALYFYEDGDFEINHWHDKWINGGNFYVMEIPKLPEREVTMDKN